MHIVAIHDISDPEKFWSMVQQTDIPAGMKLDSSLPNAGGTRAVCHWEADSVDAVRSFVEGAVGQYSKNEFYEVDAQNAVGL
jgi:hypothetical protein